LEICEAVSTVQKSLLAGISSSSQRLLAAEVALPSQRFCDFVRLIKPSPPFPFPVQGYGNNDPGWFFLDREARILPKFFHEKGEFAMEMDLPAVLVGMHDFVDRALSAGDRSCEIEKIIRPPAMATQNIFRDMAHDILAAFHAVGLFNPWKSCAA